MTLSHDYSTINIVMAIIIIIIIIIICTTCYPALSVHRLSWLLAGTTIFITILAMFCTNFSPGQN